MQLKASLLLSCCLFSQVDALSLQQRQNAKPKVFALNLQRNPGFDDPITHQSNRLNRRHPVGVTLANQKTLYSLNLTIGTPPQQVRLHLDTGSSDLWINTPKSKLCSAEGANCNDYGTYTANSSSTYRYQNGYFNVSYADSSGAIGDYATDTVIMSGTRIPDLQFGIAYSSNSPKGTLGIGYSANVAQTSNGNKNPYANLPARLAADGLIASNAYSIWLNSEGSDSGTILFGGVDREQYEGDLVTVPIQKRGRAYKHFFITMTGLDLGSEKTRTGMALAVLLDTGSSLTYLPNDLVQSIYQAVGATYQADQQCAWVPCKLAQDPRTIKFHFSKPASIAVKMSELVLNATENQGTPKYNDKNEQLCLFGIAPGGTGPMALGDTFLRSAYVVYDLDNNQISLAQSKFNVQKSNIYEITKDKKTFPTSSSATEPIAAESGLPQDSAANHGVQPHIMLIILSTLVASMAIFLN